MAAVNIDRFAEALARDNLQGSVPDTRDVPYIPTKGWLSETDLRTFTGNIEDQLSAGSCVSNGIVSGCELLQERALMRQQARQLATDLSRLFNYYKARELENRIGLEGTTARTGLKVAQHFGIPNEATWPYNLANVNVEPSPQAYTEAATQKLGRYERIYHWTEGAPARYFTRVSEGIQSALSEGLPVVIALSLGVDFYSVAGPLLEQRYGQVSASNYFIGNHLMCAVGHRDKVYPYGVVAENSWGVEHGDEGYVLLPWNVIANDIIEVWAIRGFAGERVVPAPGITLREITRDRLTVRIVPERPVATSVWVGARSPDGKWQLKTPWGWTPDDGSLPAMLRNIPIDDELDVEVVTPGDGVDLPTLTGWTLHVAFGETPLNWTVEQVLTVPSFE